jgi:hypothetical protein
LPPLKGKEYGFAKISKLKRVVPRKRFIIFVPLKGEENYKPFLFCEKHMLKCEGGENIGKKNKRN